MATAINTAYFLQALLEQTPDEPPADVATGAQPPADPAADALPPAVDPGAPPADTLLPEPGPDSPIAPTPEDPSIAEVDPLTGAINEYLDVLRKSSDDRDVLEKTLNEMSARADTPAFRTFIAANLSAITLLDESVVVEAQKKIRRGKAADKTAEELVAAMEQELTERKELAEAVQRISALGSNRGNSWRQLVAALCGGAVVPGPIGGEVQVPIGSKKRGEILILRPQAYLGWGAVDLGKVGLTSESPTEYLGGEEQTKLGSGAPEERRVLRNRMVIEAIADQLGGGVYALLVVEQSGSWHTAYFDSEMFREAYEQGTITVIEPYPQPGGVLAFDADGNIVNTAAWGLSLIDKNSGVVDPATGEKKFDAVQVAESKGERLVYTGDGEQLAELGSSVYDHSWTGEPKDLESIRRSVPSARETIMGKRT